MIKTIAIFGISGVGKSTLINYFIKNSPEWTHLQAGQLIKAELKNIDHDKLRLEGNEAILKNQYLMIDAFWREIDTKQLSKVIFDGHSIIDTGRDILDIPVDVIQALKPDKLVFIKVAPSTVLTRRTNDNSRDRPVLLEEQIEDQQNRALRQVEIYSAALSVPVEILENPEQSGLSSIMDKD